MLWTKGFWLNYIIHTAVSGLVLFALLACGEVVVDKQAYIGPDIDATVEARVELAKASLIPPTPAPLPTYTSVPVIPPPLPIIKIIELMVTAVPLPTYTPAARIEVIVEKIVTVVVTATPTPILESSSMVVATSKSPTVFPTPTSRPDMGPTVVPTPMPTTMPTPTPTPMSTPVPASFTKVGGILISDTVWNLEGSPYLVTDTVQLPAGATLFIQSGVTVQAQAGLSNSFLIHGNLVADGSIDNPVTFDANGSLLFSKLSAPSTMSISLNNTRLKNGKGIIGGDGASHGLGSFQLSNSTVTNMSGPSQIWSGGPTVLRNNIFIYFEGFRFGSPTSLSVTNNKFVANSLYGSDLDSNYSLEIRSSPNIVTVRHNSFLSEGTAVLIGPANQATNVDLADNYWGTVDVNEIEAKIRDYSDNITLAGPLNYQPFLEKPHPVTP